MVQMVVALLSLLAGRRVIVTGASSGIGASIARIFAGHGARVAALGRAEAPLRALEAATPNVEIIAIGDLTESGSCERLVSESVAALGGSVPVGWSAAAVAKPHRKSMEKVRARGIKNRMLL